ncbi:unnamed protein product [Prorocentrum cordatum]|uniref:Uncharacterized protein n=2 Tax=Prorocentrum cordatum TaxID=2364126 RepID=A0ABN9Q011_9DINO|nr:unnamed protein product [Polarella glacialis]
MRRARAAWCLAAPRRRGQGAAAAARALARGARGWLGRTTWITMAGVTSARMESSARSATLSRTSAGRSSASRSPTPLCCWCRSCSSVACKSTGRSAALATRWTRASGRRLWCSRSSSARPTAGARRGHPPPNAWRARLGTMSRRDGPPRREAESGRRTCARLCLHSHHAALLGIIQETIEVCIHGSAAPFSPVVPACDPRLAFARGACPTYCLRAVVACRSCPRPTRPVPGSRPVAAASACSPCARHVLATPGAWPARAAPGSSTGEWARAEARGGQQREAAAGASGHSGDALEADPVLPASGRRQRRRCSRRRWGRWRRRRCL